MDTTPDKTMKFLTPKLIKQLLQYGTVGLCALAVDVGTFLTLRAVGVDLVPANVLARLAGAITAYSGNHLWTFSQPTNAADWARSSWRYALVWVAITLLSTSMLASLTHFGAPEAPAKLGIEMLMPLLNFFIARRWVFR
jgi:putative flippase GtrA